MRNARQLLELLTECTAEADRERSTEEVSKRLKKRVKKIFSKSGANLDLARWFRWPEFSSCKPAVSAKPSTCTFCSKFGHIIL